MTNGTQQTAARKRRQSTAGNNWSAITKEQWAEIAEELQSYFPRVQFKYQDTVITVTRERAAESRTVLAVYFDGTFCYAWGDEKHKDYNPITRLFWFEKKKRLYPAKRAAKIEKELGKRRAKEYFPRLNDSISFWFPFFSSSTSLIRQFKKTEGLVWLREKENNSDQS